MNITNADIVAWEIVADILPRFAEEEAELLPEIAATYHEPTPMIGAQPGAFNAPEISSTAISAFLVVLETLKVYFPKLFDAALDVGKDYLKARLRPPPPPPQPSLVPQTSANLVDLRKLIIEVGKRHKLSRPISEGIADAVIARVATNDFVK